MLGATAAFIAAPAPMTVQRSRDTRTGRATPNRRRGPSASPRAEPLGEAPGTSLAAFRALVGLPCALVARLGKNECRGRTLDGVHPLYRCPTARHLCSAHGRGLPPPTR